MPLSGQVQGAMPSVPGFDSDTVISAALAQQCYALGYKFCLRYLSLDEESPGDLSAQEAADILNSGLALMPVQHVREPGWFPTQSLGQQDGGTAVLNAQNVGFPAGVNVWCDFDGAVSVTQLQNVIGYCEAWYEAVQAGGYVPGLYVGAGAVLNGQQLDDLPFQHYWRSASNVPDIPNRSYQLIQFSPTISINGVMVQFQAPPTSTKGVQIDLDFTQNDNLGGQSQWLRLP